MVWLMPGARETRFALILLLTWLVSIAGFAHIIAGSVDVSFLIFSDQASVADYLWRFFALTLLGNIVGGVTLVTVLNYDRWRAKCRHEIWLFYADPELVVGALQHGGRNSAHLEG